MSTTTKYRPLYTLAPVRDQQRRDERERRRQDRERGRLGEERRAVGAEERVAEHRQHGGG